MAAPGALGIIMDDLRRRCNRCKKNKPLVEFPRHRNQPLGRSYWCISCSTLYNAQHKQHRSAEAKAADKANKIRWYKAHPQAKHAHNAARALERPVVCKGCGIPTKNLHAHHVNYSKPLQVKWLCISCHRLQHTQQAVA